MLKITKNQSFNLYLQNKILEKLPQAFLGLKTFVKMIDLLLQALTLGYLSKERVLLKKLSVRYNLKLILYQ